MQMKMITNGLQMAYTNPHVEWICRLAIGWLLPSIKTEPTIELLANKIPYPLLETNKKRI